MSIDAVLVADGEVLSRMTIADYLRECGFRVIEAATGDEALLLLGQEDFRVDVILADVALPGSVDGFGLARWARREREGVDVILAATQERAAAAAGDLCEEGPHLAKPYEPQTLHDRIRRLLAARRTSKP